MLSVVVDEQARSEFAVDLDELVLQGARRMLAAALEAEVAAYIEAHAQEQDERGHRLVRRNGHARERTIATGAGRIPVAAPRVDDRRPTTGHRPASPARSCRPGAARAQGQRGPATAVSARPVLQRLRACIRACTGSVLRLGRWPVGLRDDPPTAQWQAEREAFMARCLVDRDYVYIWAGGVHFIVRLAAEKAA